jgi:signal transduction histidine kinase
MIFRLFRNVVFILFYILCYSNRTDGQEINIEYKRSNTYNDNPTNLETVKGNILSLGISSKPCFGKVTISSIDLSFGLFTVLIDNSLLDEIEIYKDSAMSKLIYRGGQIHPSTLDNTGYSFQLANIDGHAIFYFKIKSDEQLIFPIQIHYDYLDFIKQESQKRSFYFFYLGVMIVMILYNIFIFITVRDKTYLKYVSYVGTVLLTQMVISGYADKYFWPANGELSRIMSSLIPILSGLATIWFSVDFIRTKEYSPKVHKALMFFALIYLFSIFFVFSEFAFIGQLLINFNASCALILVIASISAIRNGYKPAKFYLFAWSFFLFGVTLYALRNFGVLQFSPFTNYALPIGSAIEAILLSLALADRINILKREKEASQIQAMSMMEENQRLVHEQKSILEQEVNLRTSELQASKNSLEKTVHDLQLTQKQLVESEKLASLGQMTAGIAHEINNPVNFVRSNVQPLKRDVDELLEIINEFKNPVDPKDLPAKWDFLLKRYQELDIDYLQKEIHQLLNGIDEGSKRTADIVRSLRVFSRMDRDVLVLADVNECISSTLMVMKNITSKEATVITELEPQLPQIMCFPGKLNQVLMNLISNAVHATKMENRGVNDRLVTVKTVTHNDKIQIVVKDNGSGMKDEVRKKIFDPFFTTKQVGEGTGLGLSIVLGIVHEHGGEINVESEWGTGTSFIITLPMSPQPMNHE